MKKTDSTGHAQERARPLVEPVNGYTYNNEAQGRIGKTNGLWML